MKVFEAVYISVFSCCSLALVFPTHRSTEQKNKGKVLYLRQQDSQCGLTESDRKFPWTALIQYTREDGTNGFYCRGTLIAAWSVLTAAHCLTGPTVTRDLTATAVRLGEWEHLTDDNCDGLTCVPAYMDVPIEKFFVPIMERPLDIDIAVVRLKHEVYFTSTIQPACLPLAAKKFISYFGDQAFISPRKKPLRDTGEPTPVEPVDITSWDVCSSKFEAENVTLRRETHICAVTEQGTNICLDYSGGGLYVEKMSRFVLIGVLSRDPRPCRTFNLPTLYTRIDTHMYFIRLHMK